MRDISSTDVQWVILTCICDDTVLVMVNMIILLYLHSKPKLTSISCYTHNEYTVLKKLKWQTVWIGKLIHEFLSISHLVEKYNKELLLKQTGKTILLLSILI